MTAGTPRYGKCMADLHQFRESLVREMAADDF
jgi:hypothetical protein